MELRRMALINISFHSIIFANIMKNVYNIKVKIKMNTIGTDKML